MIKEIHPRVLLIITNVNDLNTGFFLTTLKYNKNSGICYLK